MYTLGLVYVGEVRREGVLHFFFWVVMSLLMGADVDTATDRTGWAVAEKEGLGGGVMVIVG